MTGENDEYAFGLTNDTISRAEERSTCGLCGYVRLWNATNCIECDRRDRRRVIVITLFAMSLMIGAMVAAMVIVELRPDLLDGLRPFELLEESAP